MAGSRQSEREEHTRRMDCFGCSGHFSGVTLQLAVLNKLPYDKKERIEKISDVIAFLVIPAVVIVGLVWLMCRQK